MNPDPYAPLDPDTPFRLDHILNFFTSLGLWVAIVVGVSAAALISWRLHSPETYEERFATPARLLRWRLWAYASWHRLCKRCGLSASEQITRRNKEGQQVTIHPLVSSKAVGNRRVSHHPAAHSTGKDGTDRGRPGAGRSCHP